MLGVFEQISNPIAIDSDMFKLSNTAPQRFRAVLTQALTLYYQPALQRCIARTTLTLSFTCCFIQNRAPLLHWIVTSTDKNLFLSLYPTPQHGEENTLFCKILRNLAPILFSPRIGFQKITLITLSTRFTAWSYTFVQHQIPRTPLHFVSVCLQPNVAHCFPHPVQGSFQLWPTWCSCSAQGSAALCFFSSFFYFTATPLQTRGKHFQFTPSLKQDWSRGFLVLGHFATDAWRRSREYARKGRRRTGDVGVRSRAVGLQA